MLGLPLLLGFSLLKKFKQFLSNEPWLCVSTSLAKPLCPFLTFGIYNSNNNNGLQNPTNTNKFKQDFDILFINSHPLAGNHDSKEIDLSFAGCICLNLVKFYQLWQLNLLDLKLVCIIEAILLLIALF